MLLEQLVEKAAQPAEYDWNGYYSWLFGQVAGREVTGFTFWQCPDCLAVNFLHLPARYGKCRKCGLIHLGGSAGT